MRRAQAPLVVALLLSACGAATTTDATSSDGHGHAHGPQALLSPQLASDEDPAAGTVRVRLSATPHRFVVGESTVDGLAFNHQVPGPTIRARRGQLLEIDFDNGLAAANGLHLHGLDAPWAMDDGAPDVPPGGQQRYRVRLERSGTFWYHPRRDTARSIDLGLYGLLIVDEPGEPQTDSEVALVLDAFGETVPVSVAPGGDGHTGHSHADINRTWVVNGLLAPVVTVAAGTSIRARVLNASNAGYLALGLTGPAAPSGDGGASEHGGALLPLRQIAAGQGLLPSLRSAAPLLIGPGDRAEVELLIDGEERMLVTAPWSVNGGAGHGDPTMLLDVKVTPTARGLTDVAEPRPWPFVAAPPAGDPGSTDGVFVLQGEGDTWLINGRAGPGDPAGLTLPTPATVEVRNLSSTLHPVHLHGVPFEVLSVDGVPSLERAVLDTLDLGIGSRARLRIAGREAGPFLLECASPSHAAAGMAALLRFGP